MNNYDVIIIGSGISGLTSASILSQLFKKKVLVLERHFKIGGFTHIFKRKGECGEYHWDVGLHYVGQMDAGSPTRAMFDYVTSGNVKWKKMPDPYDVFVYPDFTFRAMAGENYLKADLIKLFPSESPAINNYFSDLKIINRWSGRYNFSLTLKPAARNFSSHLFSKGAELALMTVKEYLDRNFKDEKLKAVLASQWGDYGLPPSQSSMAIHALIVSHYISGGYYPVGGSKKIADSISPIIKETGGELLVNHTVKKIIVDKGKAIGVKVIKKEGNDFIERDFFADKIISTAGAKITYNEFIPEKYKPDFADEVKNFPPSIAHVCLYVGLKESPEKLGVKGENYWIFNTYNHDGIISEMDSLIDGNVKNVFVSFPSLKDPDAKSHTAELIAFAGYDSFAKWAYKPWKNRGEEYDSIKKKISEAMIEFTEKHLKGFKNLIDYSELSTPLSTEHFTGFNQGSIYGIPATPDRYKMKWIGPYTHIKNLYMSGADTFGHGIVGGLMSGALTSALVAKGLRGLPIVFKEAINYHKTLR
jgi:phytoene dehydrogenase-like protein